MLILRNTLESLSGVFRFLLFCLALCLAGCSKMEERADLVICNGKEPESLDPAILTGMPDGRVALALFEGLTRYDPKDSSPLPGLAERWEISEDGKTYTFFIRANAVWSTGEPITAHDFVWSWLRVLHPDTAADYAGNLYYIKNAEAFNTGKLTNAAEVGVQALNERTLKVDLVNPTPFFLELCAFSPQTVVPRQVIEKHGDRWLHVRPLPSSGAYELVYWRLNDRIRVKKNMRYWDAQNTASEVVDFVPVNTATTAINLYETKQVDIIWDKDSIPSELLPVLRKRPDFHRFPVLGTYFYRYNVTRKPFDDPRVRKALSMAIDRKKIVEKITAGGELPANFLVPPNSGKYRSPEGLPYDPEAARKLLAEAGFPDGKGFRRFSYIFNTSREHQRIAVELQEMWRKELNIHVDLKSVEWNVFFRFQTELDYDLARSSWFADYSDPNTFLDLFMSNNPNNRTGWRNERYDTLLREANGLSDAVAREKVLQQAEALMVRDELPIGPLFIYQGFNIWDPERITGAYTNPRDEHPTRTIKRLK
ncbi:MAG: peptide ABC transporter substrate-binding protein [Verrucomicrobiota bacterium]|nr:peptide ABC transporter substrate-binding protein [Verrucomicrobiota bacterium]